MKMAVSFGARAVPAEQTKILGAALAAIGPRTPRAVFDLDSTILSNKPRQARIVREFGAARGIPELTRCEPRHVVSWDLHDTMRLCGLSEERAGEVHAALRRFWLERFFTSEYCREDTPIPGASEYLRRVSAGGGRILYVTGRHAAMADGTLESFRNAAFPLPDRDRVQLWLKPDPDEDDDAWKDTCQRRLLELAGVACAFDNEPTHVNAYKRVFPGARVVHLDTDHSGRPVDVSPDIPSVADFRMTA
ncbi:MAG TPA: HAD hydrolase-like protein [Myxococcales bacterium]|nr:HAD hydrolase-like protein [Myxococcales bacterium]